LQAELGCKQINSFRKKGGKDGRNSPVKITKLGEEPMKVYKNIKILFIFCLFAVFIADVGFGKSATEILKEAPSAFRAAASATVSTMPPNFSELAEKVKAGVVNVRVAKKLKISPGEGFSGGPFGQRDPFEDFFGPFRGFGGNVPERRQQGVGSGFIMLFTALYS
jgi:S1-C subfamily serine protease